MGEVAKILRNHQMVKGRWHYSSLFIILMLLFVVSVEGKKESELLEISARQLFSEYEANVIAADEKYKGKEIIIYGLIGDIGKALFDVPYLTLTWKTFQFEAVCAYFKRKEAKKLAKLRKGQMVRLKGKVDGRMPIVGVILRDCEILD